VANDTTRLNNFDNLVYLETRSPQEMLGELLKIKKPAKIVNSGPSQGGIGFWAIVEILGEGQEKKKRSPRSTKKEKTEETKTETMELRNG
jgi:hypothetical protein